VKPIRPASLATRLKQDENQTAIQKKPHGEKPVGGLKAAARRTAFADVSNKAVSAKALVSKQNKDGGTINLQGKDPQGATLSKPTQRNPGIRSTAPTAAPQQKGSRRAIRKTAVYEDKITLTKRASPKIASPKVARDRISKRESQQAFRQGALRSQAPLRPLNRVKRQNVKEDEPVYSDQQTNLSDGDFVDKKGALVDDEDFLTDDEDDEPIVESKARFNAGIEVVSDYDDSSEDEDDDNTCFRTGDTTTGVTTQVLIPKWTNKTRQELSNLKEKFDNCQDDEDEGDITMVAEYGDEIFEYMRQLEVYTHHILRAVSFDANHLFLEKIDTQCPLHGYPI
jgi:G2/mitotic-specific cyclin 3/4